MSYREDDTRRKETTAVDRLPGERLDAEEDALSPAPRLGVGIVNNVSQH